MKVTISNLTDRPINISRLAPLMPTQVLGVKQEIKVNVTTVYFEIHETKYYISIASDDKGNIVYTEIDNL